MSAHGHLLGAGMTGDRVLFINQDVVVAAWIVVEPLLAAYCRCRAQCCKPGRWRPAEAVALIADDCGWHDPAADPLVRDCPAAGDLR